MMGNDNDCDQESEIDVDEHDIDSLDDEEEEMAAIERQKCNQEMMYQHRMDYSDMYHQQQQPTH